MFTSPTSSTGAIIFEIVVLLLVAAIIGFVVAYFMVKNRWEAEKLLLKGEIKQIRDQLELAQSEAAKFNQGWSECKKRRAELEPLVQQVKDLKNKKVLLEQSLANSRSSGEEMKRELARHAAEASRMEGELARLQEEKAELAVALTACEKKVNTRGGVIPPAGVVGPIRGRKSKKTTAAKSARKTADTQKVGTKSVAAAAKRPATSMKSAAKKTASSSKTVAKKTTTKKTATSKKTTAKKTAAKKSATKKSSPKKTTTTKAATTKKAAAAKSASTKKATPAKKKTVAAKKKPAAKKPKRTQAEQLAAVAAKKDTINFGRIGVATAKDKEDLKKISGIGPFIEAKLNALGIYTFQQISKFNKEDKQKVNEAIEFFPGRVERDDWVGQAKGFLKSS